MFSNWTGGGGAFSGLLNVLAVPWFLWIGFYNFALGTGLALFYLALYLRWQSALGVRRVAVLALLGCMLFTVHVMPLAVAMAGVVLAMLFGAIPGSGLEGWRRMVVWSVGAITPPIAMVLLFVDKNKAEAAADPVDWVNLLRRFPLHAFSARDGWMGENWVLVPLLVAIPVMGWVTLRRRELTTGRAMSVGLTLALLVAYVIVPNKAMGGDEVTVRFAWLALVFAVASVAGILSVRRLAAGITVYASVLTVLAMYPVREANVRAVGAVTGEMRRVLAQIPAGRTAIRLRFPTDRFRAGAGYDGVALEPLLHVESRSAAEAGWVNLTDYQAAAGIFPVVFGERFQPWHRYELWGLEGANGESMKTLDVLWCTLPMEVDYVIVLGDRDDEGRRKVSGELESRGRYRLVATDARAAFVWLYQRVDGQRGCQK